MRFPLHGPIGKVKKGPPLKGRGAYTSVCGRVGLAFATLGESLLLTHSAAHHGEYRAITMVTIGLYICIAIYKICCNFMTPKNLQKPLS